MLKYLNPLHIIHDWFTCHWVGAAISVGGALLGGAMGDDAAQGAAGDANAGVQAGIDEINKIGDRTRSDTDPYRKLGSGSADMLSTLLGINPNRLSPEDLKKATSKGWTDPETGKTYTPDEAFQGALTNWRNGDYGNDEQTRKAFGISPAADYTGDPKFGSLLRQFGTDDLSNDLVYQNGLQFGLDQGNKAIENRARALGGSDSGSVLKALTQYGNDYATTKTEGAYNRFNTDKMNTFNMLMGGTNVGQNAVSTDAQTGNQLALALSNSNAAIGANNAAGRIGSANATSGAIGTAANALGGIDWGSFGSGSGGSGVGTSIPIKF